MKPCQATGVSGDQFKISYKGKNNKTCYFKPKIHRMWFYSYDMRNFIEDHENYTVSHLCHEPRCIRPDHLTL